MRFFARIALSCSLLLLAGSAVGKEHVVADGQTLGKKAVGIRVLRSDTSHCELWRIVLLRFLPLALLGAIPKIGVGISLIDALMIFGSERRCLHDLIADTIVVEV